MLDFTSALYLGLGHPSEALRPWDRLTTGRPAALAPLPGAGGLARQLAALQGAERGTLGRSTLHLFWDLPSVWPAVWRNVPGDRGIAVHLDSGTYVIGRWAAERAAARGTAVHGFAHHDAEALGRAIRRDGRRPVVVADGFCPSCGRPAPVRDYLECARGGLLVLDDTQAIGILGAGPGPHAPYGRGGGGSLPWWGLDGADVVTIGSLAKGFGAPLAVLAGSTRFVEHFEARSDTRVYTSPPSSADIHAAERALAINTACGDRLRRRLVTLVRRFRRRLTEAGLAADGGLFPVQTLRLPRGTDAVTLHAQLRAVEIRAVLQRPHGAATPRISFLLTAGHHPAAIDRAVSALARSIPVTATRSTTGS